RSYAPGDGRGDRPDHRRRPGAVRGLRAVRVHLGNYRPVLPPVRGDDRRLNDLLDDQLADLQPRAGRHPAQAETPQWKRFSGHREHAAEKKEMAVAAVLAPAPVILRATVHLAVQQIVRGLHDILHLARRQDDAAERACPPRLRGLARADRLDLPEGASRVYS